MSRTLIDISLLPPDLQQTVLAEFEKAMKKRLLDRQRPMTYREAAMVYGYTYMTIRHYACKGQIETIGDPRNKRITHAAMENFLYAKKKGGRPRKAETE